MSFFDFSSPSPGAHKISISSSFWIFCKFPTVYIGQHGLIAKGAVSIPVTLVTILLWTLWYWSMQTSGSNRPQSVQEKAKKNAERLTWIQRLRKPRLDDIGQDVEKR